MHTVKQSITSHIVNLKLPSHNNYYNLLIHKYYYLLFQNKNIDKQQFLGIAY